MTPSVPPTGGNDGEDVDALSTVAMSPFHRCVAPMVVDHLDRCRPNGVVLDLGCGTGEITRSLSQAGFNMVGLDIDLASVQHARQLSPIGCYLVGDAHHIPLRDGAADGLVSFSTLQYVDWPHVITEARRVLSDNGRAAFVENLAGNPVARAYRRLRQLAWRWPHTSLLRRIAHDAAPRGHIAWDETTEFSMTFASTARHRPPLFDPGPLAVASV